eukprot:SAG11_NODE_707_length_7651_cov_4.133872_2_plen_80_part_00
MRSFYELSTQVMLGIIAALALLVLLPLLLPNSYGRAFEFLRHLDSGGERRVWGLATPRNHRSSLWAPPIAVGSEVNLQR